MKTGMKRMILLTMLATLISTTTLAQKAANTLVTPPETATVETWYTVECTQLLDVVSWTSELASCVFKI